VSYSSGAGSLRIRSGLEGPHRTSRYLELFKVEGTEEQFYFNKCACNEFDALIRRQALDDIQGYNPGNQHINQLRLLLRDFAVTMQYESNYTMATHKEVMDHTRSSIRKRYENAYKNIKNKRIDIGGLQANIKAFVKFEKIPIGKQHSEKPARLIQFRSYEYLYSLKSFIVKHSIAMKETKSLSLFGQRTNTIFTKLYDNPGIAAVLRESWDSFVSPVAVCCDHSKFDGHYCSELLDIEHEYWNSLFKSSYLKRLLDLQKSNKGFTQNGLQYKMTGHRASGEYTTSEGNSLINYFMIATYLKHLNVSKARIHVNGDDSVIIVEHEDAGVVSNNLDFFANFNMQTEMDIAAYNFQQISYCQTRPIRVRRDGNLEWLMVKDPWRTMARMSYCETKFERCWQRYLTGIALCELACDRGVPILQAWCIFLMSKANLSRPIGSVDKYPARLSRTVVISPSEVDPTTREDFSIAFGVTPQEQIDFERKLAGQLIFDTQSISKFIQSYKLFHQN
jgi:uncharacterized protein YacL (UPF0231 family)